MAGPFYVDPAAAGANNGSDWTNAWTSIQTAFDTAVAGEIVYCRGTQTLAAQIDVDTNQGTNAAGYIKFIGCNAAGNVDGTRFTLDGNAAGIHCIAHGNIDMIWFENIRCTNTGGSGKYGWNYDVASAANGCVFINCCADNCSSHGFRLDKATYMNIFHRCTAYLNGASGFSGILGGNVFQFCSSHDNTGDGFTSVSDALLFACLVYDNGDDGIEYSAAAKIINCTVDANADDGLLALAHTNAYPALMVGSRVTNHSGAGDIGINANSEPLVTAYCYFEDNDGDNIQNATLHNNISIENTANTSNIEDQANTNEGYTDKTNDAQDFNLRSDASLRRTSITIPRT